jgi:hypothetical protein
MFSLEAKPGTSGVVDSAEELPDAPADGDGEDEPAFEFRLFSTSGAAPKVVVADEDEGDGAILASRPQSYHLKEEFTVEELERFNKVAVDYADIIRGAQQRAWGLEVPWKVTKITLAAGKLSTSTVRKGCTDEVITEEPGKRKRPGKKRRIVLRTKEKERKQKEEERKAKAEAAAKQRLTKEEHLKEKKKRLNREKKLKRRQKGKEKKLSGKADAGAPGGDGRDVGEDHSSSGSDGES